MSSLLLVGIESITVTSTALLSHNFVVASGLALVTFLVPYLYNGSWPIFRSAQALRSQGCETVEGQVLWRENVEHVIATGPSFTWSNAQVSSFELRIGDTWKMSVPRSHYRRLANQIQNGSIWRIYYVSHRIVNAEKISPFHSA